MEHLQRKLCKSRASYDFTKAMHIMHDQRCWSDITAMTLLLKSCIFSSWTFPSSLGWTFSLSSDFNLINFLCNKTRNILHTAEKWNNSKSYLCFWLFFLTWKHYRDPFYFLVFPDLEYYCKVLFLGFSQSGSLSTWEFQCTAHC